MKATAHKENTKTGNGSPFFTARNGNGFFDVQPKLNIGNPGDRYEQEADRVADKVVNHSTQENGNFFCDTNSFFGSGQSGQQIQEKPLAETVTPLVQRQEMEEEELQMKQDISREEEEKVQMQPVEEEEEIQPKFIQKQEEEEEEMLQTFAVNPVQKNHSVENSLKSASGNGTPMDNQTRTRMESGFGADFGNVKIHTGSKAVQMNKQLGAQAFTNGNDIYFNEGKYDPAGKNGNHLLAHELTHTLQQGASKAKPENSNPKNLSENGKSPEPGEIQSAAPAPAQIESGIPEANTATASHKVSEDVEKQTNNIDKDAEIQVPDKTEKFPSTQTAGEDNGIGGNRGTTDSITGQQETKLPENLSVEESTVSDDPQAEAETAGGGGGPAPNVATAGQPARPSAVDSMLKIISAPESVIKPHAVSQAVIIQTDSFARKEQVRQLALLRRISISQLFAGTQFRLLSFFETQKNRLQLFIADKQVLATSAVMGAIALVQGIILNALQRGISFGNNFAELVRGIINSSNTAIQERIGGIVNQITGLIDTISLPDLPGVEFARNMARNAVNQVGGAIQNTLNNVAAFIEGTFNLGMNLFNTFLNLLISKVNAAFSLVSSVLIRILNMIFNLLNRALNLVSSILNRILFGTVIPVLNLVKRSIIQAINQEEQEALHQIDVNTELHLEALADAVSPKAGAGDGGSGGGPSENSKPVTVGEFIAGIRQIGLSSIASNRIIVQDFITRMSGISALIIPILINAGSLIIAEIRNRIAAVITNLISIIVSIIQNINILIDVFNIFITTIIQEFSLIIARLGQFIVSLIYDPVTRLIEFAQNAISRIRSFISRLVSNFVSGNSISFNLSSVLGSFSMSPATGLTAPAFAGPPIQIIGGLVIIIIGGVAIAISTFTAVIILVVVAIVLLILLYLLYKWLTKPKIPAPPKPPPKPTGKEYDPGANFNVSYSVPLEKNDIQASAGEKLIFGVEASDQDRYRQIGTAAWTTIPGTGPYEVVYKVNGDADFITSGSGIKTHTDPTLHSRNIFLFIKNIWKGKKITVTATVRDKALPAVPPDVGTTKDPKHQITWTIVKRKNACPTSLKRVGGPGSTWVSAPAVYTYLAMPEIKPPGRPNYEKQTVLESFANTTANGSFTMADLKTNWKTANPTLNTPDKVANFLYGVSGNGTFVFNNLDRISDQHSGFGTTSPFKSAALSRASGVGYKKDQTYSCSTTNIGSAVIERKYSTVTGIMVKKTGP